MSKSKSTLNLNPTNYRRLPASALMVPGHMQEMQSLLQQTLSMIAKHLPSTQEDVQQISQQAGMNFNRLGQQQQELILLGHGPRGTLISEQIQDEAGEKAFQALLPTVWKSPLNPEAVLEKVRDHLTIQLVATNQEATVLPTEEMFGARFFDISDASDTDLVTAKDGVYLIKNEQFAIYTLRVQVDETTLLLFSSNQGPSLATYSKLEERWVQHTCWQFADHESAMRCLNEFFASANVHAPSKQEVKRLADSVDKALGVKEPSKVVTDIATKEQDGLNLKLDNIFTLRVKDGDFEVESLRSDIKWEDLSSYTRRQMFDSLHRTLAPELKDKAVKVPVKKTAKKTATKR